MAQVRQPISITTNRYIYYTYDATGKLIRKQQYDNAVLQTTTDYIDGFVYITQSGTTALSYFPMPEGRVVNTGSGGTVTLTQEFVIADQHGNARVAFRNNGSGSAVVYQENSYYAFGLIMPNSPVATPTVPNKQLYNGGSEWQNDYSNLPDYYETYYRNYDAALGRWVGVDPMAEGAESMTTYQYSGNNPIMFNDPLGNLFKTPPNVLGPPPPPEVEGHLDNSLADQFESDADNLGGGGLYSTDPGLADYLAMDNGTEVYNVGDGTANNPRTGSLANAVGIVAAAGANIVDDDGRVVIPAGYSGGIATYTYNNGTVMAEPNSINDDQVQRANNSWFTANQGGADQQQNGFNIPKDIAYMNSHADPYYIRGKDGYCARAVGNGLQAGGLNTNGRPKYAKNYGPFLRGLGFVGVNPENYIPEIGDIRVFESYPGQHPDPAGHIDIYNGTHWISDFIEPQSLPGPPYRLYQVPFQIYRWPGQ